ncbi:MAG: hypothetical protein J5874_06355 [Oscillospiraceae bacterium]|nr:hypothetical protein [Oscillospiraceae bacterium]
MLDYILVFLSSILLAVGFIFQKNYQNKVGSSLYAVSIFSASSGLISAAALYVYSLIRRGLVFEISRYSVIIALIVSLTFFCNLILGFKMMKLGGVMLYPIFLMVGGMVCPYIWGVIKLGERLGVLRIIGLAVIMAGVIASNFPKKDEKVSLKTIMIGISIFLSNGILSIAIKEREISGDPVSTEGFLIIRGLICFLLFGLVVIITKASKGRAENEAKIDLKSAAAMILPYGVLTTGLASIFQMIPAGRLNASVLYPILTGGCVVFTAAAVCIVYRKRIENGEIVGTALCMIGTLMFL